MTVYVLSTGSYSARSIVGIFSSRDTEYEVDQLVDQRYGPVYAANIELETGTLLDEPYSTYETLRNPESCVVANWTNPRTGKPSLKVWSPISPDHARKVAVEKRQEWLRTNQPTPANRA
jgi:hypothetical protein